MARVRLDPVDDTNWRQALALGVRPDQQAFVSDHVPIAAVALAKAYVGHLGMTWRPRLFVHEGTPVGFAAIALPAQRAGDAWVFHFFIDREHQGRGLGRSAMSALVEQLSEESGPPGLSLTVHPANAVAQSLYRSCGFAPTGDERFGEPVYRLPLRAR